MHYRKSKGISPLISFALTVGIILASVTTVWIASQPVLSKSQDAAVISESRNIMKVVDEAIRDVLYERRGSSRLVSVTVTDGTYRVNAEDNSFDFELDTSDAFVEGASQIKTGNLYVSGGRDVNATQQTVNSAQALVLENSHTMLAIRQISPGSIINSSHLILRMRQKDLDLNLTPVYANFTINELGTSINGTGYTEFVDNGTKYGVGQMRARINSDSGINYTITFSLPSNADYFIVEIGNISGSANNVTAKFGVNFGSDVQTEGTRMAINHGATAATALIFRGGQFLSRTATTLDGNALLEVKQGIEGNKLIVAFTRGNSATITGADISAILKYAGSFGFGTPEDAKYYSWLYYSVVDIINTERLSKGTYQLSVYNNGTANGKAQIEIAVV